MKDDSGTGRPGAGPRDEGQAKPRLSSGSEFAGLGMQFAGAMGMFGLLGWWLDGRLGTEPWLLMVGIFAGATAAFYSMYRRVFGAPRPRAGRRPDGRG